MDFNKKQIIKNLQRLNNKDLITLEEKNDIIFNITAKDKLTNFEVEQLYTTFEKTKQIKEIIKRRNELIDILMKKERNKKC